MVCSSSFIAKNCCFWFIMWLIVLIFFLQTASDWNSHCINFYKIYDNFWKSSPRPQGQFKLNLEKKSVIPLYSSRDIIILKSNPAFIGCKSTWIYLSIVTCIWPIFDIFFVFMRSCLTLKRHLILNISFMLRIKITILCVWIFKDYITPVHIYLFLQPGLGGGGFNSISLFSMT